MDPSELYDYMREAFKRKDIGSMVYACSVAKVTCKVTNQIDRDSRGRRNSWVQQIVVWAPNEMFAFAKRVD